MSSDLVGARYPTFNPQDVLIGMPSNASQANIPARTNWTGQAVVDTTGVFGTAQTTLIPVAVNPSGGDEFTDVLLEIGNTAASTPTHFAVGLYQGTLTTAKLIGTQSTDSTTTAIAANTLLKVALGAVYTVAEADCPFGYIYVGIGYTGTASPSCLGWTGTAHDYSFVASSVFVNRPLQCAEQAVGAGGTLAASITLASNSVQAATPRVFLI